MKTEKEIRERREKLLKEINEMIEKGEDMKDYDEIVAYLTALEWVLGIEQDEKKYNDWGYSDWFDDWG